MLVQTRLQTAINGNPSAALERRMINEANPLFCIVPDMMEYNEVPENEIIFYPVECSEED